MHFDQVPERVAGLLNFVEQYEGQLHAVSVALVEGFLTQQWMGFPVSQVSGRRSNQFGDLMAVVELGAVDLNLLIEIVAAVVFLTQMCGRNTVHASVIWETVVPSALAPISGIAARPKIKRSNASVSPSHLAPKLSWGWTQNGSRGFP